MSHLFASTSKTYGMHRQMASWDTFPRHFLSHPRHSRILSQSIPNLSTSTNWRRDALQHDAQPKHIFYIYFDEFESHTPHCPSPQLFAITRFGDTLYARPMRCWFDALLVYIIGKMSFYFRTRIAYRLLLSLRRTIFWIGSNGLTEFDVCGDVSFCFVFKCEFIWWCGLRNAID